MNGRAGARKKRKNKKSQFSIQKGSGIVDFPLICVQKQCILIKTMQERWLSHQFVGKKL